MVDQWRELVDELRNLLDLAAEPYWELVDQCIRAMQLMLEAFGWEQS